MRYIELLAQSSLVFTGFAGLLFTIGESDGPREAFRAWSIVAQGFIVFGLSLLPLLLFELGLNDRMLWQTSSGVSFILMSAFIVSIPNISTELTKHGHPPGVPGLLWAAFGISTLGCLFLLANSVGWPLEPSSFFYAVGLTLFLAVSVSGVVAKLWLLLSESRRHLGSK